MSFFDKKEEVMEIQLTSYGKELLSKGDFKPMYYAFFDEGVLYDGSRGGLTEVQNDIQNRIKNETPYSKDIANFLSSKEISHAQRLVPNLIDAPELPLFDFNSSFENQLGASSNNKDKIPAWSITALQSTISSSNAVLTSTPNSRNLPIPQINIDNDSIRYDVVVLEDGPISTERRCEINNFIQGTVAEFEDGTSLEVEEGVILLKIKEENSLLLNDTFSFEIFEVKDVTGSIRAITDREVLQPLKFFKFKPQVKNGILMSAEDNAFSDVENLSKIDNTFISNYLEVSIDEQVNQEVVCELDKNRKGNNLFVKDPIDCESIPSTARADVYGTLDDGDIDTFKAALDGDCE